MVKNMRLIKSGKHSSEFYKEMWQTILGLHEWKGEIIHFIGIKEDITEKKQLFEELLVSRDKAEIPIIAQTAYADDRTKAIEAGCSGFIAKPFNREELLQTIQKYI
jgi:DNA-binding NtrC family response regulator